MSGSTQCLLKYEPLKWLLYYTFFLIQTLMLVEFEPLKLPLYYILQQRRNKVAFQNKHECSFHCLHGVQRNASRNLFCSQVVLKLLMINLCLDESCAEIDPTKWTSDKKQTFLHATKWMETASYANVLRSVVVRFIKRELIFQYWVPSKIITDNETNLNKMLKEQCEGFKI